LFKTYILLHKLLLVEKWVPTTNIPWLKQIRIWVQKLLLLLHEMLSPHLQVVQLLLILDFLKLLVYTNLLAEFVRFYLIMLNLTNNALYFLLLIIISNFNLRYSWLDGFLNRFVFISTWEIFIFYLLMVEFKRRDSNSLFFVVFTSFVEDIELHMLYPVGLGLENHLFQVVGWCNIILFFVLRV